MQNANIDLRNMQATGAIRFPASKSLLNRALILRALSDGKIHFQMENLSQDSLILIDALSNPKSEIQIGHAGTAMRFLTAFFALQKGETIDPVRISGSERMHERPIEPLVDALRALGAKIEYAQRHGFPPLVIYPKELQGLKLAMRGNVSSQFISALLLLSWKIQGGLSIQLLPPVLSESYIDMTLSLMGKCGIRSFREGDTIQVPQQEIENCEIAIERDWSSAAYFIALLGTQPKGEIILSGMRLESDQGDRKFLDLLKPFGIRYTAIPGGVLVYKDDLPMPKQLSFYMGDMPDQVQTVLSLCAVVGVRCTIVGADNLKWKESNRIAAMQKELAKMNIRLVEDDETLVLEPERMVAPAEAFATYNDHRMAMALSLFATRFPIEILQPEVVSKSFPEYWQQLAKFGVLEFADKNP